MYIERLVYEKYINLGGDYMPFAEFFVGFILGAIAGVFVTALLVVGSESDRDDTDIGDE